MELIGPYLAACALLVVAGVAKAGCPGDTARAVVASVGIPSAAARPAVRLGAVIEAALGVVASARPSPWTAGAVAVSYFGFALFVEVARSRGGPLASCGCFGTPDTPATRLHVVVDLALAGSAAFVATTAGSHWLPGLLAGQPWHGVPLVLLGAVCAWLLLLVLSRLSEVGTVRRQLGITRGAGT